MECDTLANRRHGFTINDQGRGSGLDPKVGCNPIALLDAVAPPSPRT
jgi:hypothetical protein